MQLVERVQVELHNSASVSWRDAAHAVLGVSLRALPQLTGSSLTAKTARAVRAFPPAVTMKPPARRGLELSVVEDEPSAERRRLERQRDQRLLVVGIRLFVDECVCKPARRLDREERAADVGYE